MVHRKTRLGVRLLVVALAGAVLAPSGAVASDSRHGTAADALAADGIIVRYRPGVGAGDRTRLRGQERVDVVRELGLIGADVVRPRGRSVATTMAALRSRPDVQYAVPNYLRTTFADPPTDASFGQEWGLNNTGQPVNGTPGVNDIDIDAPEAWTITQGAPEVVVAVIDDGVDFGHPDLVERAWTNPGETGIDGTGADKATNGIDDDGDGHVDDVRGWDFYNNDNSVHDLDRDFHGTHVAGTIAASVNGVGAVGVAPGVRIMGLKFLENQRGTDADAIAAIAYAAAHGARIANASWGGPGDSPALRDAITASGMLFVAAAGNGGSDGVGDDNDSRPSYPASYDLSSIIAVTAIDNRGSLPGFANYGASSVDIAAPGQAIWSSYPATSTSGGPQVGLLSGTSMAAPHVAGVASLVASVRPDLLANVPALRARVLGTGTLLPSLAGKTATGRLVNAYAALDLVPPSTVQAGATLPTGVKLGTSSATLRLAWAPATDGLTGVARYRVEQSVNGGGWTYVTSTTARTLDRTIALGTNYAFQVRAIDRAGNVGEGVAVPIRAARSQESDGSIVFRGSWTRAAVTGASGGRTRYATRAGAVARMTFSGRAISLVAPKSRSRGSAKIYIDGALAKTVSLYSSTTLARQVVFQRSWPTPGTHTIRIVVSGTRGHPRFDVDAFVALR